MSANVLMVVGLGFGDEGKGSIVDHLARKHNGSLVVRFNGGAQAAHNVVTSDGHHHTFSQFGSATLAGGKTFLSRYMLVNPLSMINEAKHLVDIGVHNPLSSLISVADDAVVTTPDHIAANRAREKARDASPHGTCGMGIGETRQDQIDGLALRVRDIGTQYGRHILYEIRERRNDLLGKMTPADQKAADQTMNEYNRWASNVNVVDGSDFLRHRLNTSGTTVIFEGAQGVLLDEKLGCQPHTTWTDCTLHNAYNLILETGVRLDGMTRRIGVLRSYATRHGAGPFPTEDPLVKHPEPHNSAPGYQGAFRQGHFDVTLARYALSGCAVDELAITHIDRLSPFGNPLMLDTLEESIWTPKRARVTADREEFIPALQALLQGPPITITSSGPTSEDKCELTP